MEKNDQVVLNVQVTRQLDPTRILSSSSLLRRPPYGRPIIRWIKIAGGIWYYGLIVCKQRLKTRHLSQW
ncbi:hypothetical protein C5167_012579 [Papaver somniferum]|uniref:Uncharacterized protein n=1 Tax=Papaver somniferum TaxID=3469 RepID=A0A4Y7J1T7_PAPSO|nr:hypothetical protein C5167_012579 [Papaver somniferum]